MNVLIVEDNALTVEALEAYLRGEGYRVDYAGNGHGALTRLEVRTPDVIILDIVMPGMDGLEFLGRLRGEPRWRRLPVVLTTAAADEDCRQVIEAAQHLGPLCVLRKPFDPSGLLSVLDQMTREK